MLFLPTSPFAGGQNEQEFTLLFLYLLAWIVQRRNRPAPAPGVVKKERLNRVGVVVACACAAAADYHWCVLVPSLSSMASRHKFRHD
jgi:hypothetical protein